MRFLIYRQGSNRTVTMLLHINELLQNFIQHTDAIYGIPSIPASQYQVSQIALQHTNYLPIPNTTLCKINFPSDDIPQQQRRNDLDLWISVLSPKAGCRKQNTSCLFSACQLQPSIYWTARCNMANRVSWKISKTLEGNLEACQLTSRDDITSFTCRLTSSAVPYKMAIRWWPPQLEALTQQVFRRCHN